jgi:hypothetical protein
MTTLQFLVRTPVQAHETINGLWKGVIQPHTRTGAAGVITWETHNAWLRRKMRAKFHGPVLRDISEQVWLTDPKTGLRYRNTKAVWKEFFRELFIEPDIEEYKVRATGEIKYRLKRLSTESLSDDQFSEFLTAVEAYAITELDVEFQDEGY